jgi:murein DD-endopeptidase MepM/ murein hydrolase activator NlpD
LRGRITRVVALLIAAILFISSVAFAATPEQELEQRRQELLRVQKEIEEQQAAILAKKKQEQGVTAELRKLQQQLDLTEKELGYIEADLAVTQKQAIQTEADLKNAQASYEKHYSVMQARLVSYYEVGPAGYVEVLLGATDFSDFLSRADLLSAVISQDVKTLTNIKTEREQYLAKKSQLQVEQTKLASLKGQTQDKRSEVTSRTQDREKYLKRLQLERAEYEKALDELESLSEELVKTIQDMQKSSGITRTGQLTFGWPVTGKITSAFGNRLHPVLRKYRYHSGIDIAVKSGTLVKASEDGVVLSSGWLGGYGKAIILDHGQGYSTLYGHNSTLLLSAGAKVTKGQVIAYSGSTGLSTGPHVHFEIRLKGTPVDPTRYLK